MSIPSQKKSVRITWLQSGFSPPVFILASFTDPPWEPQAMKFARQRVVDKHGFVSADCMFWRRFHIYPGVWEYKYRIGYNDWHIIDHRAETGVNDSGEELNILRVQDRGPAFFQSPTALPAFESDTSSSPEFHQSWHSVEGSPELFSTSPDNVAGEGSDISNNPLTDAEQPLLIDRNTISPSSSPPGSGASVESTDPGGFVALCFQSLMAWIYNLLGKVFGRSSDS